MIKHKHTCVILQSSYIPWRGYFDLIRQADTFVFLDQVQFTRRDWRTRNKILTQNGPKWLTVPVKVKDTFKIKIYDVQIDNTQNWHKDHLMTIAHSYAKSNYKKTILDILEPTFSNPPNMLWELNRLLTKNIWNSFSSNLPKNFIGDEEIKLPDNIDPNMRLISICKEVGADHYISGPSAKDYLDFTIWKKNNITISFASYNYPKYLQINNQFNNKVDESFEPAVSIIDLLMNLGPDCMNQALGHTTAKNLI